MNQLETLDEKFARILKEYGGAFARLAGAYEPQPGLREDLTQEIALAVWRALPTFRGASSERTFLYRIAHNRALTHISKRRHVPADLEEAEELPDTAPNPETILTMAQLQGRLREAVGSLSFSLRQVWVLALEGMSNAEIASILGISENNVAVRLARGRKYLRERIGG